MWKAYLKDKFYEYRNSKLEDNFNFEVLEGLAPLSINHASNRDGKTAIQLALEKGLPELASFMTTKAVYSSSPRDSTSAEAIKLERAGSPWIWSWIRHRLSCSCC